MGGTNSSESGTGSGVRGLLCPKDRVVMERVFVGSTAIDRCYKCGGIWLDAGEYEAIRKHAKSDKDAIRALDSGATQGRGGQRFTTDEVCCPRDGTAMRVVRDDKQQHIELELCSTCSGMFLDAGELTDLNEFTLGERIQSVLNRLGKD